ncbi:ChbG/HpnK family deacetylase [Zavarzinia sp.]|uniref:ChbG/HpnK family deacetylase n=1 Tax=Zavarzinia sp. TaxID=2027920 RepID=UPI003566E308
MPEPGSLVLCADDYGLSDGICDAVDALIAKGRLTATGAMTGLPAWRRRAQGLRRLAEQYPVDVGLHLTLTDQRPLTAAAGLADAGALPPVGRLIRGALTGSLPRESIRDELGAQLDAFEDAWGGPPDFVDGHQHAHVLPGIRRLVVEEIARRYPPGSVWLRTCGEPLGSILRRRIGAAKAQVVSTLAAGLPGLAARNAIPTNDSFRGFYDFGETPPYAEVFRRCLAGPGQRILLHCHPGRVDAELRSLDSLLEPRERELAFLASDECGVLLDAAGLRPARFRDL